MGMGIMISYPNHITGRLPDWMFLSMKQNKKGE